MKPSELVAKAMAKSGCDTRYKLHKLYGLPEQSLSNWANDKRWPDSLAAATLAQAAGLDPWLTICELEEERASTEAQKTAWSRFLSAARVRVARLAAEAAAGLKVALPGLAAPAAVLGALHVLGDPSAMVRIIPCYVLRKRHFWGVCAHP